MAKKTKASLKAAAPAVASTSSKKTAPAVAATKACGCAKKAAPAKKATEAKSSAAPVKAANVTAVFARIDIGWGNRLYLRGSGAGLSWDVGIPMECSKDDEWFWKTTKATEPVTFKFLKNDERWALGEDLTVDPGKTSVSSPTF